MHAKIVSGKKVRYGIVGAGKSTEQGLLARLGTTGNSILAGVVTSEVDIRRHPGTPGSSHQRRGMAAAPLRTYPYSEFDGMLANGSVDAVYLALPNFAHVDFAVKTLDAGVHLLLDAPMAASVAQCERILAAARRSGAKLMIGCGTDHHPALREAVGGAQAGRIGGLRAFRCIWSRPLPVVDNRASHGFWAGPAPEMGTQLLGAIRSLFAAEPIRVSATGVCTDATRFHFDDTVSVALSFTGGRSATFTVNYGSQEATKFWLVGSNGEFSEQPASGLLGQQGAGEAATSDHRISTLSEKFTQFSEYILEDREPESDGEGGLLDVRILAAIERSLQTGESQTLDPYYRSRIAGVAELENLPQYAHFDLAGSSSSATR